ncbi:MAG: GspMb/PilO family protein [Pseudomonadota bacterium]|nr:GspMb/PilO family protein [Pseudomonadota bacterium]
MKTARIQFHVIFQFTRLGWPGALGAVLLLAALATDLLVNLGLEEEVATRQAQAASRALLPAAAERQKKPITLPRERAEIALPRLFAAARRHGLSLDEGRYAETGKPGESRFLRIDLPVIARYSTLRAFLAEVLDENPALLLESLELRRDDIGATELDARLRFMLNLETAR